MKSKSSRILSTLALLFALPVGVLAGNFLNQVKDVSNEDSVVILDSSSEESHRVAKQSSITIDEHDHDGWNELTSSITTLTEGNWYLSSNVVIENAITVEEGADVTLCLNGYAITVDNTVGINVENIRQGSETSFTLSDCSEDQRGEISFSDDAISGVGAKYAINAANYSSYSSIEINFTGGTINATSTNSSSTATGIYAMNDGSLSNSNVDINIDGGFVNASNVRLSYAVRPYIYGSSSTNTDSCSINVNMMSGGIFASSSSNAAHPIYGVVDANTRYCSIDLAISGGTLQNESDVTTVTSYGFYITNSSSTTSTSNVIIDGGYHDYSYVNAFGSVEVNAGYFTDGAYDALTSYVSSSSTLKTFSSTDDALALDEDYDANYPNVIYVAGSEAEATVPGAICVDTDVEQFISVNNNSSVSTSNYSYTGTTSGDGLPTAIGEYEVTLSYEEHISGNIPKEYFEVGSTTMDLTIADHTPGSTYLYTDTNHWLECINTYCDLDNSIGLNNEEHTILYSYDEDTHYAYCEICDLVGEEEEHTMIRRVCRYCGYSLSGQIRDQTSIWYVVIIVLIVLVFVFLMVAVIIGMKKSKKLEPGYVKTEKEKNKELKDNYKKIEKEKNKKLKEDNKKAEKEKDKAEKEKAKKLKEEQKRAEKEKKKAEKEKIKAEKEKNKQQNK